jgi:Tfp pilus assembly protein PilZ
MGRSEGIGVASLKDRKSPRFIKRYPVTVKVAGNRIMGFSIDLSSSGLAMSSKKPLEPKELVTLDIKAGRFPISLQGEVRWCRKTNRADTRKDGFEMGFELQSRNAEYIELLEKVITELDLQNSDQSYQEDIHISYETRWQFVMDYEKNIRLNQLFIPTIKPFKVMQKIKFTMHLLEYMRILHAEGTVMYVVGENDITDRGKPPGVGLQIDKYRFGDETLMKEFVKKAGGKV